MLLVVQIQSVQVIPRNIAPQILILLLYEFEIFVQEYQKMFEVEYYYYYYYYYYYLPPHELIDILQ